MKKLIISLMVMASMAVSAQGIDHYSNLQLNLGGGVHTYLYEAKDAQAGIGFGGLFEAQYQLMFNHNIGIALGAQISNLTAYTTYNNPFTYSTQHEDNGETYDRTVGYANWKERQLALAVSVPFQFIIRAPINLDWAFQAGIGASYDLPIYSKFKVVDGAYRTEGYFPSTNVTYQDLPNHGFSTYSDHPEGDFTLRPTVSGLLDMSVSYPDYRQFIAAYVNEYVADHADVVLQNAQLSVVEDRIRDGDLYHVEYLRINEQGVISYHQMTFGFAGTPETSDKIILAFKDVDKAVRKHMADKLYLRQQLNIVQALSRDYYNVFKVDLNTGLSRY